MISFNLKIILVYLYSITVGEEKINDAGPVVLLKIWD